MSRSAIFNPEQPGKAERGKSRLKKERVIFHNFSSGVQAQMAHLVTQPEIPLKELGERFPGSNLCVTFCFFSI